MGKVLIAAFDDKEEITFDELLSFLKSKSHIKVLNTFPNNSCLRYGNLEINAKYLIMSLKSYICWHSTPDKYFLKSKYTTRCGKNPIMEQRTM